MKKGRPSRGGRDFAKEQRQKDRLGITALEQQAKEAKERIRKEKAAGVPIFRIFAKPKVGGVWLPCGEFVGEKRATAVVNAWMTGFMEKMYKTQLDQVVARSLYSQGDMFTKSVAANYHLLQGGYRKVGDKNELDFGYIVDCLGLEEKKGPQSITVLEAGMEKSWFDKIKESVVNVFKSEEELATK